MDINEEDSKENNSLEKRPTKECRYCAESISVRSKVCINCNRHQNPFWQHFRIEQIGLVISIIMVGIAFVQLKEARKERVEARVALNHANKALESFRQQAELFIRVTWIQVKTKHLFGGAAKKASDDIIKSLATFLEYVIPDKEERQNWVKDLVNKLPKEPNLN